MLLIEKILKLMDDYHYNVFYEYVKNLSTRSYYPLVLIECIDRDIVVSQEIDTLCKAVYEDVDEKTRKKFLQLAHYTFRLTSHLSKNYPAYLKSNITVIQKYINEGQVERANCMLDILLDIAQKLEDYSTYATALNIQAHYYHLTEDTKEEIRIRKLINKVYDYQYTINSIYLHKQEHFSIKSKAPNQTDIDEILAFFKQYHKSNSQCIQLLSKYFYLAGLNYFKSKDFFTEKIYKQILALEKQFEKNEYIIFPFLEDLNYHITYLKLRYLLNTLDDEKVMKAAAVLLTNDEKVLFWKNYFNAPEMFSIAVQTSYLVSNYMIAYQDKHLSKLPSTIKKQLKLVKEKCKSRIDNRTWETTATVKYINVVTIYAGLLVLGNTAEIKDAIRRLEGILFTYQQVPFHAFIDPIFTVMIMGYFCLKQYDQVELSYRRYRKMTDKKVVNPENNLTIHAFYYTAKWLATNRKQYIKKLGSMLEKAKAENRSQGKIIGQLIEYYDLPLSKTLIVN